MINYGRTLDFMMNYKKASYFMMNYERISDFMMNYKKASYFMMNYENFYYNSSTKKCLIMIMVQPL